MRPALALPPLLLLAACAGDDGRQDRADCQRRIVEAAAPTGRNGPSEAFAEARERLGRLAKEGCTDDQVARADLTARAAGRVAEAAARVGDLRRANEQGRTPGTDRAVLDFAHELEQYEQRRAALQLELERLAAEAKAE